MGQVFLAFDRQAARNVALKCFPQDARRHEDLAHFEHEFLTLSRLRHPNLAEVYDFGVDEGTGDVFFTFQFIDGHDLFEWSEGLAEDELAGLVVQVCRGLEYIHSRQIIHYDVKPSNILVRRAEDGSPQVKLIDFGLAAEQVDDALGIIKGTVSYLAPELARHLPVDHRADLYSLGVTLFHCVTRTLPFKGETNLDVVRRVVSDPPPNPRSYRPEISRGLAELILRLMAKEPSSRYPGGNDVIRVLGRCYGHDYGTEPREALLTFVTSGGFFGRDEELRSLTTAFDQIFTWAWQDDDELPELPEPKPEDDGGAEPKSDSGSLGFVLSASDSDHSSDWGLRPPGGEPEEVSERLHVLRAPTDRPPSVLPDTASSFDPLGPSATYSRSGSRSASGAGVEESLEEPREPPCPLPQVQLVSGEVGVGKSRLLQELKTYAQLRRAAVAEGHGSRTGGAYSAFVQVFRAILGLYPEGGDQGKPLRPHHNDPLRRRLLQRYGAEMVRLIPELDSSAMPVAPRAQLAPEQEEVRLLDALAQFLIGYSRSRPLVILLHDLDEAGVKTLELLRYLCRNLALIESTRAVARRAGGPGPRPLRLLVVASYQPSAIENQPQGAVLESLLEEAVTSSVSLGPLGPEQVYQLVESMLGVGSEPRELAARIYDEAKGNPYFTVELMRSLVESEALTYRHGRWETRLESESLALPDDVAEVIRERARRIPSEDRGVIDLLAVLGRGATIHELSALSGDEARGLVAKLGELERRQVLHAEHAGDAVGARRYDFIHDLAREAIYASIQVEDRLRLHLECGTYLEKRHRLGGGAVDLGELVRHFTAAGDRKRALSYGIRAGDQAGAVHANHQAIEFYGEALALLPVGSARWRDLLMRLGDLLALTGAYDQAVEAYDRILVPDVEERLGPEERARAFRRKGEVLERQGDYDAALETLSQGAFTAYEQDGLEREAAGLFAATASIYQLTGRYQDAIGFCEVGLSQLLGMPEDDEVAQLRTVMGRARLALGDTAGAEEELELVLSIRRQQGNDAEQARTLADLGEVALETGALREATERFERALEREAAIGHAAGIAKAAARLARSCQGLGDLERSASLLRRALSIHTKSGARAESVRVLNELGRLHLMRGEYTLALEHLRRAHGESERLGLLADTARALNGEARLLAGLGQLRGASEAATEALRLASLQGDVPRERAAALESLGRVEVARTEDPDDLERAEQLLHEAQALFRAQKDQRGVLRTTLSVLDIFLRRGDLQLLEATLASVQDELPPRERAWLQLYRVRGALAKPEAPNKVLLGELERAVAVGERFADAELLWRVAQARGQLLARLGHLESALESYVEAMSGIRELRDQIPEQFRNHYVRSPQCLACREEFMDLRSQAADGAD
jgi:serine/threonine protein kinase/tetratricopeptide (TPR) repeat protein